MLPEPVSGKHQVLVEEKPKEEPTGGFVYNESSVY